LFFYFIVTGKLNSQADSSPSRWHRSMTGSAPVCR